MHRIVKFNLVNINIGQSNKEASTATIQLFSKNSGAMMEAIENLISIAKSQGIEVLVEH